MRKGLLFFLHYTLILLTFPEVRPAGIAGPCRAAGGGATTVGVDRATTGMLRGAGGGGGLFLRGVGVGGGGEAED